MWRMLPPGEGNPFLHATVGDLTVNGDLDASGTAQTFYDLVRYTGAGSIRLRADAGSVTLGAGSVVDVAAAGPGDAGSVEISAPTGSMWQRSSRTCGERAAGAAMIAPSDSTVR